MSGPWSALCHCLTYRWAIGFRTPPASRFPGLFDKGGAGKNFERRWIRMEPDKPAHKREYTFRPRLGGCESSRLRRRPWNFDRCSPFSFEIDQTLSAYKTASTPTTPGRDPTVTSIGGKFQPEGAPFYVDLSYERHKDMFGIVALGGPAGASSKDTGLQVGGGMSFGDLGLHARYERLKYESSPNEYKRDAGWFAVKYNLPSGYVGAELGIARDGKINGVKANDTGAKMFGVGYFHNLSKQSQLQFIYGRTDNQDNATYTQAGAPLASAGSDHQVFHVGLKHTF